ncbi:MAG: 50S ribosomal protein L29 [Patescibacteria group bacterium]
MEFKELKVKTKAELTKILDEQRENLRDLRFKAANRKLKNFTEVKTAKALVARILTILNQSK